MLTDKEIQEAREEAKKWDNYLMWFEEVYNHCFAPRGYGRDAALIAVATLQFGTPMPANEDDDRDIIT